jgi:hypothetical protein
MSRRTLAIVPIVAAAALLSFRPIYEPDLWWHLAHGREDAAGPLVRSNVFSFNYPEYRQRFTTWLFDTTVYVAWSRLGGAGVQMVQLILLSATLLLLYAGCRTRAPAWAAASVLFVGFFILEPRAIPRPHLVSFAGVAACALLVERARASRGPAPLLWTVPLVALWSNFHVECVFGVALVAIFAGCELVRPAAFSRRDALKACAIAAACGLATLANPYGWGLIAYLYENISVPGIMAIAELRPPYLPDYRAFYAYLVLGVLLLLSQPKALRLWEAVVFLTFAALGTKYLRLIPLVLLATAPMLAARLPALAARGLDPRAILVTAFALALALSRIPLPLLATGFAIGNDAVEPQAFFSRNAVEFVRKAGLQGPVFNSHNLGGYLAWAGYPEVRIFQDSRLQAYPPEHFRSIIVASQSQADWNAIVADVDWAVLSVPRPNQLSGAGRFPLSDWATVFRDEAMEIVVRRGGSYGGLGDSRPQERKGGENERK